MSQIDQRDQELCLLSLGCSICFLISCEGELWKGSIDPCRISVSCTSCVQIDDQLSHHRQISTGSGGIAWCISSSPEADVKNDRLGRRPEKSNSKEPFLRRSSFQRRPRRDCCSVLKLNVAHSTPSHWHRHPIPTRHQGRLHLWVWPHTVYPRTDKDGAGWNAKRHVPSGTFRDLSGK